jgi:hypothetical protein
MKLLISMLNFIKRLTANWLDFAPESAAVSSSREAIAKIRREIQAIDQKILKRYVVGRALQAALQQRELLIRQARQECNTELQLIEKNLRAIRRTFAHWYEAWTGEPFLSDQQPAPMEKDIVIARGYRLAALAAASLDGLLVTFLMAEHFGLLLSFPAALITTFLLTVLADKAVAHAARCDAPCYSLHLITRYVFFPALAVTTPALLVILAERYVTGLPLMISALFDAAASLATLIATPSLMLLGGALLALADLYAWSLSLSHSFDQLIRQHEILKNERDEFPGEIPPPYGGHAPGMPPYAASQTSCVALVTLLALSSLMAGCESKQWAMGEPAKPVPKATGTPVVGVVLNLEIDRSGSPEPQAAAAVAQNLHHQLARIIGTMQITEVRVRHFGADGWSAPVALSVAIPRLQLPPEPVIGGGEFANLPNRRKDYERRQREEWERAKQQARAEYQRALDAALAQLTADILNPNAGTAATCTDAHGVLARISAGRRSGREVYLIVTDGYDTCSRGTLPALAAPQGNVKTLVLQTAATAREGEGKRPAEQYASRRTALQKIAPWAEIVPAFESNLADYLRSEPAVTKPVAAAVVENR